MASDDGPPTPVRGSGSYPGLQQGARDLAAQLQPLAAFDPGAEQLRKQLIAIAVLLGAWSPQNQPTKEDRTQLVNELVEATKRAMAMLERARGSK